LLEDYDLLIEDDKSFHLNRIILSYEDRHLRVKILIKPSFALSMFFHYPKNPEIKPSISKGYISNITHLHDVLVDNMLWIKQINGEVYFQMIYTLYDIIDNKFLPTNQPLSYTTIANKYYYSSTSTSKTNEQDQDEDKDSDEFFTNLKINELDINK
jgi:hypothetical protein